MHSTKLYSRNKVLEILTYCLKDTVLLFQYTVANFQLPVTSSDKLCRQRHVGGFVFYQMFSDLRSLTKLLLVGIS